MQICDEAPKYLIVLVAIKQSTPFLRLCRVLLSLYILQIRPSALTRFCPKMSKGIEMIAHFNTSSGLGRRTVT